MTTVEFTSEAVRTAKFREKLKGYSPDEVDAFLQQAAGALDELAGRLAEATDRATRAEAALADGSKGEDSVRRTLVLAQRTAEMAIREANDESSRIKATAREEAERVVAEAKEAAAARLAEAEQRGAAMEQQAEQTRAAAIEHATATVDEADAKATTRVREAEERAAALLAEMEAEVATKRREALAEIEQERERAHGDVMASVRSLESQRHQLWADVERLSTYLADERARVLDALAGAVERFGESLAPAPLPVLHAGPPVAPAEDAVAVADAPVAVADSASVPEDRPVLDDLAVPEDLAVADDLRVPDDIEDLVVPEDMLVPDHPVVPDDLDEDPPGALLFTLEDENRRADGDRAEAPVESRGRKPLLGRRRA